MRWIDIERLRRRLPVDWLTESKALLNQLIAAPDKEARAAILKGNATHWNKLREALWGIGGEKCWYTEMLIPCNASVIEHFRPKSSLATEKHDGYWWLSFEWKNFRISSSIANIRVKDKLDDKVKGKGTYFPLLAGTRVVTYLSTPQDPLSIGDEVPLLLDPLKLSDVSLLTFNHDGLPVPNKTTCKDDDDIDRVYRSIGFYCLDEGTMNGERADLWRRAIDLGARIEGHIQKKSSGPLSAQEELEVEKSMTELARMAHYDAQYSAAVVAAVKSLGSRGWTDGVLAI